ncbi:MAG: erythronate-4-phosphate dehydrogenase [Alteromonadaceae bacterium]|nr:MAG: erythronate-4-phosphate dehydrogenase [Alteromonadaceae bacterium]
MKIVADENIPNARTLFSPLGEVSLVHGRRLQASDLSDADALIVRSVTEVNPVLLASAPRLGFVGTCTIGTDHLDLSYLQSREIRVASAPGCNANAVVQYVLSSLVTLERFDLSLRVAIVGCGNVGGRLYRALSSLGFECICVDPFLTKEQNPDLHPIEAIYSCDIICVHTPLTKTGSHPTYHMFSYDLIQHLKPGAILLNAGRGGAIDNQALNQCLDEGQNLQVVLDVWENEPAILEALYQKVKLGTPHIAGYSFEGRVNGAVMILDALADFLNCDEPKRQELAELVEQEIFAGNQHIDVSSVEEAVIRAYDVSIDHTALGQALPSLPQSFDHLRKHYRKRRDFGFYRYSASGTPTDSKLQALGFIEDGK